MADRRTKKPPTRAKALPEGAKQVSVVEGTELRNGAAAIAKLKLQLNAAANARKQLALQVLAAESEVVKLGAEMIKAERDQMDALARVYAAHRLRPEEYEFDWAAGVFVPRKRRQ